MTQENKELLLEDLCARLPYGIVIQEKCIEHDETFLPNQEDNRLVSIDVHEDLVITNSGSRYYIEEVKPYLFPLSSMTEKQKREFDISMDMGYVAAYNAEINCADKMIEFFNKNHFDYKGLIEKGLAIDATGLNIY